MTTPNQPSRSRVSACVIEIDRWGRFLLHAAAGAPTDRWTLPSAAVRPGESPDATALRAFDEATGEALDELRYFRALTIESTVGEPGITLHAYYMDADLDAARLGGEGDRFLYAEPAALAGLDLTPLASITLSAFVDSPAYRALFH